MHTATFWQLYHRHLQPGSLSAKQVLTRAGQATETSAQPFIRGEGDIVLLVGGYDLYGMASGGENPRESR